MKKVILLISMLAASMISFAQQDIYTSFASSKAIKGYDPVAYFTQDTAVKGDEAFSFEYKGANWLFSSKENLDMFKENPGKYEPQYGGYCAFAMAKGKKFRINPQSFSIIDDKLYLNYSSKVRDKWLVDTQGYIEQADIKWNELAK